MKVVIDDIPEQGIDIKVSEPPGTMNTPAGTQGAGTGFTVLSPVSAAMRFTRTGDDVHVTGEMKTRLGLVCSRCLKEFERDIETSFSVFFVRGRVTEREKELSGADLEVNYITEPEIDTGDILIGQLAMETPIQTLCAEDCKGLCPRCGADLNDAPCACPAREDKESERIDARLSVLKDFKPR